MFHFEFVIIVVLAAVAGAIWLYHQEKSEEKG